MTDGPAVQWGPSAGSLTSNAAGASWNWADASTGRAYSEFRSDHARHAAHHRPADQLHSCIRAHYPRTAFNQATMTGLTPGATVFYRVGSADGWSSVASFTATRTNFSEQAPLRIGWFGDLGVDNAQALDFIKDEAAKGVFDHVVHVGDYAYDLPDQNGAIGDQFQQSVQPVTSSVPYMGCARTLDKSPPTPPNASSH